MPAKVVKSGKKYRLVEEKNGRNVVVKNKEGTAVDGGGHSSRQKAIAQAQAININS